jgi:gamma-glutamylcyclotransferase (GGCT)/AIG2-like uncharacterized protein YtfP
MPSAASPELFFFYGALVRGGEHHDLVAGRARYLGEDSVAGTLRDLGRYCGARPGGAGRVHGEVFEVTDPGLIADLDAFEGEEYTRVAVRTQGGHDVWVYQNHEDGPIVPGGDWRAHLAARQ